MSGLDRQNDNVWRKHKDEPRSPAIMESIQSISSFCNQDQNFNADNSSPQSHLSLHGVTSMDQFNGLPSISDLNQSFLLIDGHEYLKV